MSAAHRRSKRRGRLVAAVVAIVAASGAAYAGIHLTTPSAAASAPPRASLSSRPSATRHRHRSSDPASSTPLRVLSTTPANGAGRVGGAAPISVKFSAVLAQSSARPSIVPSVPGTWRTIGGTTMTFTPAVPFIPESQVTMTIPAGRVGIRARSGATLPKAVVVDFGIEDGSTLRLQQLLSLLDYSPLAWTPVGNAIPATDTIGQVQAAYAPPPGRFSWRQAGWPTELTTLWKQGQYTTFTRGLVMSFQADHGLNVTGVPDAGLWNDMLTSLAEGVVNTGGYNFALADKVPPQTLTIWHDGTVVLHAPANTGIPQSPTPSGIFPVYARYRYYVMHGKNPDGTPYSDPVQYVAYFYDGDAVHYFPRADYGIPQSLGCVELPLAEAAVAWPYLAYGTLVRVVN